MTRIVLKIIFASPLIAVMAFVAFINIKIHYDPERKIVHGDTIDCDLLKELHGLKQAMKKNADIEMQQLYPEGYIFFNAIYALAWANFIEPLDRNSAYFKEGRSEIQVASARIGSDHARSLFSEDLLLPYGAFYSGWSNYVLGKKLSLEPADQRSAEKVFHFKQQCKKIAAAIVERPYPASYYGNAWPADVVLCVASLSLHDRLFEEEYDEVIKSWIHEVKNRLDRHGLIPHAVDASSGKPIAPARGSSQSLMLIFLREIDPAFACGQFTLYSEHFIDSFLGLTGIREYVKGESGTGDIDSGPVIAGFGGAATIVGMQSLSAFSERERSIAVRNAIEAFALPFDDGERKKYLFGQLPIADAFVAWGHSAIKSDDGKQPPVMWFHFYSLLIFLFLAVFFWILVRAKKPDSEASLTIPW